MAKHNRVQEYKRELVKDRIIKIAPIAVIVIIYIASYALLAYGMMILGD